MKRHNLILTLLLLAVGACLYSCSDDLPLPPEIGGDEMYDGIVLRIPDPQGLASGLTREATTADKIDIVEKEGLVTSLDFFAFPLAGDTPVHVDLLNGGASIELPVHKSGNGVVYKDFDLTEKFTKPDGTIDAGPWNIYVVANLNHYIDNTWLDASGNLKDMPDEKTIKELPLHFFEETPATDGSDAATKEYLLSQANIKKNGLPMACMPDAIQYRANEQETLSTQNNGVTLSSSGKAEIHADLSFLCSKVRYTVFFDKISEGSAKDIFKNLSFDLAAVSASAIPVDGTEVASDKSTSASEREGVKSLIVGEYAYPAAAATYPNQGEETKPLAALGPDGPEPGRRAWQGILYLPENSSSTPTTLSFLANAVKTEIKNGKETLTEDKGATLRYTMPLLPKKVDESTDVKRGFAYDIVASVTKIDNIEIAMDVMNVVGEKWDVVSLQYSLTPPAYLHVDKTAISVQAGHQAEMWYESNAEISFDSPKYGDLNLYTFEKEGNTIKIGVSSRIPTSAFDEINRKENIDKYNFFHIIAGNIRKRIDVTPLLLQKFMNVTPETISIDVREQKASGRYDGFFDVVVDTNIEEFKITDVSWKNANPAPGNDLQVFINDGGTWRELEFDKTYSPVDGQRIIRIKYNNLNSGSDSWNHSQTFEMTFSVDNGDTKPGPGYISPVTVTSHVIPYNENYVIHFRDNESWDNAHIYVYQCLEMPSYWNKEHNGYNMASMPVGYEDRTSDPWKIMAALEYSFTGAIAFKGWESYSNNISLRDYASGRYNEGFWVFSDGGYYSDTECSWNPSHGLSEARYEKGASVDFCKEYRPTAQCSECRKGTGNASWPGIRMKKDSDGWWSFELTGIATPGKALIMFTNGHSDYYGIKRYPADLKVGIPLFDYPSREGWFDLNRNNNTFVPTKPGTASADVETRRFYFDNSETRFEQPYIYLYEYGSGKANAAWPGNTMAYDEKTGYWYCDVTMNAKYDYVIFNGSTSDGQTADLAVDASKNLYGKKGAIGNVDENGGNGENPDSSNGQRYRFYFPNYWNNAPQHLWLKFSDGSVICQDDAGTQCDFNSDYNYVEFKVDGRRDDGLKMKLSYYGDFDDLGTTLSGFGTVDGEDYRVYRVYDDWRGPYLPETRSNVRKLNISKK